ncbi:MAG TPA: LysR family transcriptional regulator [Polyangia bacterium]|nr:LysR family transcriptional regulator [Polyangia bacterium]
MRRLDLANFNLNLLLALDGLLSERSVSAAAKRVRVTPSAMSHSLAELRDRLGDPLLVRAGRGMVLTPRAEALVGPLHTVLKDVERLLRGGAAFDPGTATRRFVIAAPDFLATLLLPPLLAAAAREAPGTSIEIVPSARRGNAWLLETGDADLALGAIVDDAPGIRRADLYTEGFACAARVGHPTIRGALDLDLYVATPHLLITLGDDATPTWVDQALARLDKERRVAARVRYFMAAPLVVAKSDLLLTGPSMLIRTFAELMPLQVLRPPIELPSYPEEAYWHERFDDDPAHAWLRKLVKTIARGFGLPERPRARRW